MISDNAVEVENESVRLGRVVSEWYALNPDSRQLWVYEAGKADRRDALDGGSHFI